MAAYWRGAASPEVKVVETKVRTEYPPMVLHLGSVVQMNEEQFSQFCRINDEWHIERSAEGTWRSCRLRGRDGEPQLQVCYSSGFLDRT